MQMNRFWRAGWTYIVATKRSVWAFLVAGVLGLFSMGLLGWALYYAVCLALPHSYPNIDAIHGDWVWPTFIGVGMAWSFGFLLASALNLRLERSGITIAWRRVTYVLVLWVCALLLWLGALAGR